jgi:hypothetical protein
MYNMMVPTWLASVDASNAGKCYAAAVTSVTLYSFLMMVIKTRFNCQAPVPWYYKAWHLLGSPLLYQAKLLLKTPLVPFINASRMLQLRQRWVTFSANNKGKVTYQECYVDMNSTCPVNTVQDCCGAEVPSLSIEF